MVATMAGKMVSEGRSSAHNIAARLHGSLSTIVKHVFSITPHDYMLFDLG